MLKMSANTAPDFVPIPGAGGYQLSNPSALDLAAFQASLSVFQETDMRSLRKKSKDLTGYLEALLLGYPLDASKESKPWKIITPSNPEERGAQLSILLEPGLLDTVMEELSKRSVVIDERKPDVIRVAPTPLYNSFLDVWLFVDAFRQATVKALEQRSKSS
jgi:kynureninase